MGWARGVRQGLNHFSQVPGANSQKICVEYSHDAAGDDHFQRAALSHETRLRLSVGSGL